MWHILTGVLCGFVAEDRFLTKLTKSTKTTTIPIRLMPGQVTLSRHSDAPLARVPGPHVEPPAGTHRSLPGRRQSYFCKGARA